MRRAKGLGRTKRGEVREMTECIAISIWKPPTLLPSHPHTFLPYFLARVISRLPGGPGSFSVSQPAARRLRRNWPWAQ